jgi:hypothetical protein
MEGSGDDGATSGSELISAKLVVEGSGATSDHFLTTGK